jgi:hypothetical protein
LEGKTKVWYEGFLFGGEDLVGWEELSKGLVWDLTAKKMWSRNSTD